MAVIASTLFEAAAAPNAQTVVYTAAQRTIIDKCTGYGVAAADLTINLVPNGGAAGSANVMEKKTFAIGETYTYPAIVGHVLEVGDAISVIASLATSINLRISGRKVT